MPDVRRAVRVVLLDPADRVLLLWHARPGDEDHWAPPGGGVEPGESLPDAVVRELREEVGLTGVTVGRPVWVWQHRFSYFGTPTLQHETVYAVRLDRAAEPRGGAAELAADGITAARWWSLAELDACPDEVWPPGLAGRTRDLLRDGLDPERPLDLTPR